MFLSKRTKAIILFVLYLLVTLIIFFMPMEQDNRIKIIYNFDLPYDTSGKLILHSGDEQQEITAIADPETYRQHEMVYHLGNTASEIDNISFELQYDVEKSSIKAIEFYNHTIQVKRLAPKEIVEYFNIGNGEISYLEGPYLIIEAQDESPTLIGNELWRKEIQSVLKQDGRIRFNIVALLFFFWLGTEIIIFRWDVIKTLGKSSLSEVKRILQDIKELGLLFWKKRFLLAMFILGFVCICVFLMAVKSKLYHHPDEDVTRMAIDYYLGGWLRPAGDGSWVAGTFSDYGVARALEKSWYYFFAGKIGWLVERLTHLTTYFRILNVALFAILAFITFLYGRKEKWLFIVLLFTPQLWYLFSYATSDAWDFFWGVIIAFELLHEDSALNRYLEGNKLFGWIPVCLSGVIFAFIFEGKKNYYSILLFAFINLLFRLFPFEKEKVKKLLPRYMLILVATFLAFQLKVGGLDQIMNRQDTPGVLNEEQHSIEVVSLKEQSKSLKEVIIDEGAASSLLRSFVGRYGWQGSYDVSKVHMKVMFGLYVLLVGTVLLHLRGNSKKDILEALLQMGVCGLMIFAVFIQCWTGDFQPQGRYILPNVIIFGSVCAKNKKLFSNVLFNCIMFMIVLCNLYSYLYVGINNMIIPYL